MLNRPGTNDYSEETAPDNVECATAMRLAWVFNPSFPLWGGGICNGRKRHLSKQKIPSLLQQEAAKLRVHHVYSQTDKGATSYYVLGSLQTFRWQRI